MGKSFHIPQRQNNNFIDFVSKKVLLKVPLHVLHQTCLNELLLIYSYSLYIEISFTTYDKSSLFICIFISVKA